MYPDGPPENKEAAPLVHFLNKEVLDVYYLVYDQELTDDYGAYTLDLQAVDTVVKNMGYEGEDANELNSDVRYFARLIFQIRRDKVKQKIAQEEARHRGKN